MSQPSRIVHHADVDGADPERAAVDISSALFPAVRAVLSQLDAEHGADAVAAFLHCFMGRFAGFLAVVIEPSGAIKLLDGTVMALRKEAPEMERDIAAQKGRMH